MINILSGYFLISKYLKKYRREKCVTWVVQNYFFSLFLKFPNNGIRAIVLEGPVRENSFLLSMASTLSPLVFDGENYHVWAVKMKAHLRGLGLWQWVESEREEKRLTVAEAPMEKKPKAGKKLPKGGSTASGDNNKKSTITSREIQTAIRLVLPGELVKIAV